MSVNGEHPPGAEHPPVSSGTGNGNKRDEPRRRDRIPSRVGPTGYDRPEQKRKAKPDERKPGGPPVQRARKRAATQSSTQGAHMNWDVIEGNWEQFKGKVRAKWGKLTDDDLEVVRGKWDTFYGLMHERYGLEKDEAEKQLDSLYSAEDAPSRSKRRLH